MNSPAVMLAVAALFSVVALVVFAVFLRPAATQSAAGVITSKTHRAGGTHLQQQVGINRGFRTPTAIAVAESYSFEVKLDDAGEIVRASLNVGQASDFDIGQRVVVEVQRRGVPGIWGRVYVLAMHKVT
jgi:hypothetical protein